MTSPSPYLLPGRQVPLGGVRGMSVTRWLPHRGLPMVGAWCFLDRFGPQRVDMRVLPHPHSGLQTVTWPLAGQIRHRDSLGTDVVVGPGQLNLMTSGLGIAHSEISVGEQPLLNALQLWVALPDGTGSGTAGGPARFEQHRDLPVVEAPGLRATMLVGALEGLDGAPAVASPALVHTPLLGVDLVLDAGADLLLPLRKDFEHAVLVLEGAVRAAGTEVGVGPLLHLGTERSQVHLVTTGEARVLLLGGEPFAEDLVMWWNFVGRTHEDVAQARADWEDQGGAGGPGRGRFGVVPGHGGERIPAPELPSVRLIPRRRAPSAPGAAERHETQQGAPAPAMS